LLLCVRVRVCSLPLALYLALLMPKCGDYFTTERCQAAACPSGHHACHVKIHEDRWCEGSECTRMDEDTCCYDAGFNPKYIVYIVVFVLVLLGCLAYWRYQHRTVNQKQSGAAQPAWNPPQVGQPGWNPPQGGQPGWNPPQGGQPGFNSPQGGPGWNPPQPQGGQPDWCPPQGGPVPQQAAQYASQAQPYGQPGWNPQQMQPGFNYQQGPQIGCNPPQGSQAGWNPPQGMQPRLADLEGLLPPGWESAYDSCHGRDYYFNRETGMRQWNKPQAIAHGRGVLCKQEFVQAKERVINCAADEV